MTQIVRGLLKLGNEKVGEAIHTWSLPAKVTCVGASETCLKHCYALTHRYQFETVKERLAWNLEQARKEDFVERMVKEIKRKGCQTIRIHCSGDFPDQDYAQRWLTIMQQCSKPRYYFYSRSHIVPEIAEVFAEMAKLKCCRVWYSCDKDLPPPEVIPERVRIAYLQTDENDIPDYANLIFRIRKLRKKRIPLSLTCPSEGQSGEREITCSHCNKCVR